jgi:formiminotetrahydrofolate cyclodeaminase
VDRLASGEPAPGGGSASAVAASLGAGLVAMVAALSEGRPRYAEHAQLHAWGREQGHRLAGTLLALAEADAAAYGVLAAAMKLPRDSEAQVATRKEAMRAAARTAADVPLHCVVACREVVQAAEALAGRSNVNASSDLNVAALLGEAGARGAAANVMINLPMVADEAYATEAREKVARLLAEIERLAQETHRVVESGEVRLPHVPGTARA